MLHDERTLSTGLVNCDDAYGEHRIDCTKTDAPQGALAQGARELVFNQIKILSNLLTSDSRINPAHSGSRDDTYAIGIHRQQLNRATGSRQIENGRQAHHSAFEINANYRDAPPCSAK